MQSNTFILVVDDMAFMRGILCRALREVGLRAVEASSAHEAIRVIKRDVPAIIFLDIGMPNMDGIEMCRWIRSQEDECRDVPIIICSAHRERKDVERAIAAGANDYLLKPVQAKSLKDRLEKYLPDWPPERPSDEKEEAPASTPSQE